MDITIDTSALLAVCTNEAQKTRMVELTAGARLLAPVSVHSEMGNALSAILKRERITLAQALACLAAYQQIPVRWLEVDLPKALTLAHQLNLYAYDAYLLACAQATRSHLLTLDKALIRAAREVGVQTLEVYVGRFILTPKRGSNWLPSSTVLSKMGKSKSPTAMVVLLCCSPKL